MTVQMDDRVVDQLTRIADALEARNEPDIIEDDGAVKPRVIATPRDPSEQPSMTVTYEYNGKVYEGILYAVRDIEK